MKVVRNHSLQEEENKVGLEIDGEDILRRGSLV